MCSLCREMASDLLLEEDSLWLQLLHLDAEIRQELGKCGSLMALETAVPKLAYDKRIGHETLKYMLTHLHLVGSTMEGPLIGRMFQSSGPCIESEIDVMLAIALINKVDESDIHVVKIPGKDGFYNVKHFTSDSLCVPEHLKIRFNRFLDQGRGQNFISAEDVKAFTSSATEFKDDSGFIAQLFASLHKTNQGAFTLHCQRKICGPACNNEAILQKDGTDILKLSIDGVPCIEVKTWPADLVQEWSSRDRQWPSPEVVRQALETPCHLVAKPQWNSTESESDPSEWRLSFTRVENLLASQRTECQNLVYLVAKAIYYRHLYFEVDDRQFSSYCLKTSMMWMMEQVPPSEWMERNCRVLVLKLFNQLSRSLQDGFLPYYFNPQVNLLVEYPSKLLKEASRRVNDIINRFDDHVPHQDVIRPVISKIHETKIITDHCQRLFVDVITEKTLAILARKMEKEKYMEDQLD